MRILLTGGGTGGHIYPLTAIVSRIKKITKNKGLEPEFLFVGPKTKSSLESFKNLGIPCRFILAGKIRRYWSLKNFLDFFKIPIGFIQALWWIFIWMPDVCFGKGGYGSVASVIVSWVYRIPIVLHESDAVPGLANRILGIFSQQIIVSFSKAKDFFSSKKTVLIGNPLRSEILEGSKQRAFQEFGLSGERMVIFVTGGSQGAQRLNYAILEILPELLERYEIIHQCGADNYSETKEEAQMRLDKIKKQYYHLYPFLREEMKDAYAVADLIISRCGANTLAEIAALGKPSILVPLKWAAYNHQRENANYFREKEAAIVIEEENLKPHIFKGLIFDLLSFPKRMREMGENAKKLARLDAGEKIAIEILNATTK